MKSKDIFILSVRIIGSAILAYGLAIVAPSAFVRCAAVVANAPSNSPAAGNAIFVFLLSIGWPPFIAYLCFRGAPWLADFACAGDADKQDAQASIQHQGDSNS